MSDQGFSQAAGYKENCVRLGLRKKDGSSKECVFCRKFNFVYTSQKCDFSGTICNREKIFTVLQSNGQDSKCTKNNVWYQTSGWKKWSLTYPKITSLPTAMSNLLFRYIFGVWECCLQLWNRTGHSGIYYLGTQQLVRLKVLMTGIYHTDRQCFKTGKWHEVLISVAPSIPNS